MEGAEEKFNLSLHMNGISRDLLQKFMKQKRCPNENEEQEEEEDEEIELSLGLSMNGRFGVDPARKKLKRSSSISNLVFTVGAGDNGSSHQARATEFERYAPPLVRTRSLPTEAEEEWRRRKELQSMRRMEARKKRMEKLKNVRVVVKDNGNQLQEVFSGNGNGQRIDSGILDMFENENVITTSSQGSIGPLRSSSSGSSDLLSHQIEGSNENAEAPLSSHHSSEEKSDTEPPNRGIASDREVKGANELLENSMVDMPYVTTKVDGPNGHKIEGFLYRYKKGEDVRIVCVCHGMFLSPAEFIKHGGGGDVEHPLKHIVVNPFPLL